MFNSQKFLLVLSTILFVVFASEIFYFFYYEPSIKKKVTVSAPTPTIFIRSSDSALTPTIKPRARNIAGFSFNFDEKIASQSADQIKNIIDEARKQDSDFISYVGLLKAIVPNAKDCVGVANCLQLSNSEDENWRSEYDKDFPVTISGSSFIVKLGLVGNNKPSGIVLKGQISRNVTNWWEGTREIFIGSGEEGKRLYIDARINDPNAYVLYDEVFEKKLEGVYLFFNKKGTSFLMTDLSFNKITYIDLNQFTDNKFPDGLFPNGRFYIGYGTAPSSDLRINDFSIL